MPNCNLEVCECTDPEEYWWYEYEECYSFCATGYKKNDLTRACEKSEDLMLEIKFERFDAVIELFPHGILLTPSSQTAYDGTDNNPVPVSDRGIFFGNTEKNAYMVIEGC